MTTPVSAATLPTTPLQTKTGDSTSSDPAASSGLASDFQTFLKMLTAQARFQDPLQPIDSTEYAAQLAQFSMVEQQVKTNGFLSGLEAQFGASNLAALSGWIGMDVRAPGPFNFDGAPIDLTFQTKPGANSAALVVRAADGSEVQRIEIPRDATQVTWAGVSETGKPLPNGKYDFEVESFTDGQPVGTSPTEISGRVDEARVRDDGIALILDSGQEILSSSVSSIARPES